MPLGLVFRSVCAAGVIVAGSGHAAFAGQAPPPAVTSPASDRSPFSKNAIGVEVGGAFLTEAWNFNSNHEWIGDASFAMWYAFAKNKALVVEFHAAGVAQEEPRTAFVNGIMPIFRWRVLDRGRSSMFVELGTGVSWSDTVVPPRGTRFNYLIVTSAGMTRQLTSQLHAIASVRVLHVSNASLMGPNRNPDIEAVGGYFGLYVGF
jgi:hypothetical protein